MVEIQARTADELVQSVNILASDVGLIWIDVEGHELSVLRGMRMLIATGVPLVVEFDGAHHGAKGWDELIGLLGERYQNVLVLNQKGTGSGSAPISLADFCAPNIPRDLLIY
jgi:hypothetical protein